MRELLLERGVWCVEAQELVGRVASFDGEHFGETAGETVAQSVVQWINTAKSFGEKLHRVKRVGSKRKAEDVVTSIPSKMIVVGDISWNPDQGPWFLRLDKPSGDHWFRCAICNCKCGDTVHGNHPNHVKKLSDNNVKHVPFDVSWARGWRLKSDAPIQVTFEQALVLRT